MSCQTCGALVYTCPALEGAYDRHCPACGGTAFAGCTDSCPPFHTGRSVTFHDFIDLLDLGPAYNDHHAKIRIDEYLKKWLSCEIVKDWEGKPVLRDQEGRYLPLLVAHIQIQQNKEWQYDFYNIAMCIMR